MFTMCLLFHCKLDDLIHLQALFAQNHALLNCLIPLMNNFIKSKQRLVKQKVFLFFFFVRLLQLLVLLNQKEKSMLHILIALLQNFIVFG